MILVAAYHGSVRLVVTPRVSAGATANSIASATTAQKTEQHFRTTTVIEIIARGDYTVPSTRKHFYALNCLPFSKNLKSRPFCIARYTQP